MKFDDFDKRMRVYEQSIDQYIVPGMYIVARLDGRSFVKYANLRHPLTRAFVI